jgi:hypothetical protein
MPNPRDLATITGLFELLQKHIKPMKIKDLS